MDTHARTQQQGEEVLTPALARQRCWTHPAREAVSRCPSCRRFYCRECVTEHEGRLLCAQCLTKESAPKAKPIRTRWILWATLSMLGFFLALIWFYGSGYILQQFPPGWSRGVDTQ